MTWSPFLTLVTPGPTSTTTPAPSWPRIDGNNPSGSAPDSVNSSVWQMPVALTSTSTSPALGPSRSTSMTSSGFPFSTATAARVFMTASSSSKYLGLRRPGDYHEPGAALLADGCGGAKKPASKWDELPTGSCDVEGFLCDCKFPRQKDRAKLCCESMTSRPT